MASLPVLVLNSGSSSIKFSIYEAGGASSKHLLEGAVEGIGTDQGQFWIKSSGGDELVKQQRVVSTPSDAFSLVADALRSGDFPKPGAIGHRVVSGGPTVLENQRITPELIDEIERYVDFAPLHTPIAVFIMRESLRLFPGVPNFACLDTWFHRTMPEVACELPIPKEYAAMGVRRYGAHGISYESIVYQLQPHVPEKLIVAHLGNGASVAAIYNGASIDTSMGLTPTGGIVSATRMGDIDPGVLLFILRKIVASTAGAKEAADRLETAADEKSGLLGVSGLSSDMRELRSAIEKGNARARLAVDLFVHSIRKFIGAYIAELGGLDMLVLTGGIGVHDAATRAEICSGLEPLGIVLDAARNHEREVTTISTSDSRVEVRVIPPEEDLMIVNHVVLLLGS
jgi:acetate kinase